MAHCASVNAADRLNGLLAGLFAATARFCTDAAVLMLGRMTLALLGAQAACNAARFENGNQRALVAACPAGRNASCGVADIGAVEIEPDALTQHLDFLFSEARVSAGGTGLRAVVAFFDTPHQRVIGVTPDIRVRRDHLLNVHRSPVGTGWEAARLANLPTAPRGAAFLRDRLVVPFGRTACAHARAFSEKRSMDGRQLQPVRGGPAVPIAARQREVAGHRALR